MKEEIRERFDELDDPLVEDAPTCGSCEFFYRCPIPGHESVGWCSRWDEWSRDDDEQCE